MTQFDSSSRNLKILNFFKWFFSILFFSMALGIIPKLTYSILFFLISILLFPPLSKFWRQRFPFLNNKVIKGACLLILFVSVIFIANFTKKHEAGNNLQNKSADIPNPESVDSSIETVKDIGVGETLHTRYFDIKVNEVRLTDRVETGNSFADKEPEENTLYLIINISFKNTDSESRMFMDGSVWINYNGRDYEFDKSETIIADGWGVFFDQINPLISKTTNLVYKIPDEVRGKAYWQPGRSDSDKRILLGDLE